MEKQLYIPEETAFPLSSKLAGTSEGLMQDLV